MQEVIGDEVNLFVKLYCCLMPVKAVTFSNSIIDMQPMLVENPIRPKNTDMMACVADCITVPIGMGKRFYTIYKF